MQAKIKLDDVEIIILKALLKDARANFADIAKECNLSITAVTQRYRKLKRNGTITGTTIIVNAPNSQRQHFTSIDIKAESQHENTIIEAIKKLPRIRLCFKTIGKYNIHASIITESLEQIDKVKNEIRQLKGVLEIEITMGLESYCSHSSYGLCTYPENLVLP